jgi:hypothetical protein
MDFSWQILEQKWPVFLQCTQCSPYQRHRWPLLYSLEGKMTQLTKHRAPIMHSKMDFSRQNLEQKWPVFCNIHNVVIQEKLHIPGGMHQRRGNVAEGVDNNVGCFHQNCQNFWHHVRNFLWPNLRIVLERNFSSGKPR